MQRQLLNNNKNNSNDAYPHQDDSVIGEPNGNTHFQRRGTNNNNNGSNDNNTTMPGCSGSTAIPARRSLHSGNNISFVSLGTKQMHENVTGSNISIPSHDAMRRLVTNIRKNNGSSTGTLINNTNDEGVSANQRKKNKPGDEELDEEEESNNNDISEARRVMLVPRMLHSNNNNKGSTNSQSDKNTITTKTRTSATATTTTKSDTSKFRSGDDDTTTTTNTANQSSASKIRKHEIDENTAGLLVRVIGGQNNNSNNLDIKNAQKHGSLRSLDSKRSLHQSDPLSTLRSVLATTVAQRPAGDDGSSIPEREPASPTAVAPTKIVNGSGGLSPLLPLPRRRVSPSPLAAVAASKDENKNNNDNDDNATVGREQFNALPLPAIEKSFFHAAFVAPVQPVAGSLLEENSTRVIRKVLAKLERVNTKPLFTCSVEEASLDQPKANSKNDEKNNANNNNNKNTSSQTANALELQKSNVVGNKNNNNTTDNDNNSASNSKSNTVQQVFESLVLRIKGRRATQVSPDQPEKNSTDTKIKTSSNGNDDGHSNTESNNSKPRSKKITCGVTDSRMNQTFFGREPKTGKFIEKHADILFVAASAAPSFSRVPAAFSDDKNNNNNSNNSSNETAGQQNQRQPQETEQQQQPLSSPTTQHRESTCHEKRDLVMFGPPAFRLNELTGSEPNNNNNDQKAIDLTAERESPNPTSQQQQRRRSLSVRFSTHPNNNDDDDDEGQSSTPASSGQHQKVSSSFPFPNNHGIDYAASFTSLPPPMLMATSNNSFLSPSKATMMKIPLHLDVKLLSQDATCETSAAPATGNEEFNQKNNGTKAHEESTNNNNIFTASMPSFFKRFSVRCTLLNPLVHGRSISKHENNTSPLLPPQSQSRRKTRGSPKIVLVVSNNNNHHHNSKSPSHNGKNTSPVRQQPIHKIHLPPQPFASSSLSLSVRHQQITGVVSLPGMPLKVMTTTNDFVFRKRFKSFHQIRQLLLHANNRNNNNFENQKLFLHTNDNNDSSAKYNNNKKSVGFVDAAPSTNNNNIIVNNNKLIAVDDDDEDQNVKSNPGKNPPENIVETSHDAAFGATTDEILQLLCSSPVYSAPQQTVPRRNDAGIGSKEGDTATINSIRTGNTVLTSKHHVPSSLTASTKGGATAFVGDSLEPYNRQPVLNQVFQVTKLNQQLQEGEKQQQQQQCLLSLSQHDKDRQDEEKNNNNTVIIHNGSTIVASDFAESSDGSLSSSYIICDEEDDEILQLKKPSNATVLDVRDANLREAVEVGSASYLTAFLESSPSAFDGAASSLGRYCGTFQPVVQLGKGAYGTAYLVVYKENEKLLQDHQKNSAALEPVHTEAEFIANNKNSNNSHNDDDNTLTPRVNRRQPGFYNPAGAVAVNEITNLSKSNNPGINNTNNSHVTVNSTPPAAASRLAAECSSSHNNLKIPKNSPSCATPLFPNTKNNNILPSIFLSPAEQTAVVPRALRKKLLLPIDGPAGGVSGMAATTATVIVDIKDKKTGKINPMIVKREDLFVCKVEQLPDPEILLRKTKKLAKQQRPPWDSDFDDEEGSSGALPNPFGISFISNKKATKNGGTKNSTQQVAADSSSQQASKRLLLLGAADTEKKKLLAMDANKKRLERMQNEAHILSNIAHPNIVAFVDYYFDKKANQQLLFLEYVDGGDLQKEIANRGRQVPRRYFSVSSVLHIFVQIVLAVEYLHRHNILHRDIKSQNILISKHYFAKLTDFGTSQQFDQDVTGDVASKLVGTPLYISPELVAGKPYSQKSDMWALGVLLIELLSFEYPFTGATFQEIFHDIQFRPPRPVRRPGNPVPQEILELASRLLQKDPDMRPTAKNILTEFSCMRDAASQHQNRVARFVGSSHSTPVDAAWLTVLRDHVKLIYGHDATVSSQQSRARDSKLRGSIARERSHQNMSSVVPMKMSVVNLTSSQQMINIKNGAPKPGAARKCAEESARERSAIFDSVRSYHYVKSVSPHRRRQSGARAERGASAGASAANVSGVNASEKSGHHRAVGEASF